jgi:predicted XRE-type DNA-binding protein
VGYKRTDNKATSKRSRIKQGHLKVHVGSGNVFADMGIAPAEADNLLMRSELMIVIEETIRQNGWTQAHTAKIIGVSQPRIAELFQSRIDLFTLDTLVKYLNKLGKKVILTIRDSDAS